jgi:uracil-DNA glycosylase
MKVITELRKNYKFEFSSDTSKYVDELCKDLINIVSEEKLVEIFTEIFSHTEYLCKTVDRVRVLKTMLVEVIEYTCSDLNKQVNGLVHDPAVTFERIDLKLKEQVDIKNYKLFDHDSDKNISAYLKKGLDIRTACLKKVNEIHIQEEQEDVLYNLISATDDPKWKQILSDNYSDKLRNFSKRILANYQDLIEPKIENIFRIFNKCHFNDVKVVILGQDPYHTQGIANGYAFDVNIGVTYPPSLRNILTEIGIDYSLNKKNQTVLGHLVDQGVFLLNSILTVERNKSLSHEGRGYEELTDKCIECLSDQRSNLVFMLFGTYAHSKDRLINQDKHLVIKTSHPSPFSARSTNSPFIGSNVFNRTNEYLKEHNIQEITWTHPEDMIAKTSEKITKEKVDKEKIRKIKKEPDPKQDPKQDPKEQELEEEVKQEVKEVKQEVKQEVIVKQKDSEIISLNDKSTLIDIREYIVKLYKKHKTIEDIPEQLKDFNEDKISLLVDHIETLDPNDKIKFTVKFAKKFKDNKELKTMIEMIILFLLIKKYKCIHVIKDIDAKYSEISSKINQLLNA